MTKLKLKTPLVGELNTLADPLITTGLKEIETVVNGELEGSGVNIKAKTIDEGSLTTALVEKFTNRKGLAVQKPAASETAESEKLYIMKNATTLTLPAATINRVVGVFCLEASCKVKAAAGVIKGDSFSAGEATLTENQHLELIAEGTNWLIEAGAPKQEQVYGTFVERAPETEYEPSATRPTFVVLEVRPNGTEWEVLLTLPGGPKPLLGGGGALITRGYVPFICPPGAKWKFGVVKGSPIVWSSYLTL